MKFFTLVVAMGILGASASCENGCSGHGHCGLYDICQCYGNWEGGDCSGRVCPYTKAWADTAIAIDDAHNYARCGNKGECDGKSGQCKCYEPFEGKGCRRMACPNGCSGHGTCEYMAELAQSNDRAWDTTNYEAAASPAVQQTPVDWSAGSVTYGAKHSATNMPTVWDAFKIQGCQCDPGYEGNDCASRICPSGNDPLRHRNEADTAVQVPHKFRLQINGGAGAMEVNERSGTARVGSGVADTVQRTGMGPPTFVLTFIDTFNEEWITRPIPLNAGGACDDEGTCPLKDRDAFVASNALESTVLILAHNIRQALLDLPNGAVTGEDVDPRTGEKDEDALSVVCTGYVTGTNGDDYGSRGGTDATDYDCDITFKSAHNSGDLTDRLGCWDAGCSWTGDDDTQNPGGCSPKYLGLGNGKCDVITVTPGTTNLDTCSGRGACNGADGLCECFEGFTDEDCSVQTVLV